METLKDTEQIIEKVKHVILESFISVNIDANSLNSLCNLVKTYHNLLSFYADKIQADNSIFKKIEQETNYIRIPLSAICECKGKPDIQDILTNGSLADKIKFIKDNQNLIEKTGCVISLYDF